MGGKALRLQFAFLTLILAGTLILWAAFVPGARPVLDRVGATTLLEAVGLPLAGAGAPGSGQGPGGRSPDGQAGPQVIAAPATLTKLVDRAEAIGTARGIRSASVASEILGRVERVAAAPGSYVDQGTLVAELDAGAARIGVERARLALADAERALDRLDRLAGSGAVTGQQKEDAASAVRAAELALEAATLDLARHRILAPVPGWVGLIAAEPGDYLTAGSTLTTIEDRSTLTVEFRLPERLAARLAPGMAISAHPLSDPGLNLVGNVTAVDNQVEATSRTIRAEASIPNEGDLIRPGMAIRLTLDIPGADYPSVDPLAIQWGAEGAYVWVLRTGVAEKLPVRVIQRNAASVLVEAEFAPDDLVVSEGMMNLRAGQSATIAVTGAAAPEAGG
ncbi:efflux RND transporter periplasmic adaptor subunit [Frigidibacter sp. RF13]|uniref:efflux RND transporter periplasmic adaptor subunit n=1 Tax=Frigidibacter sp. RF13 TaxID=2997340 RepID=UPI00226DB3DF|nr:efflux RND transporter periplasmic adaptor subunit [Frigidibacter sp. RF13]MCY1126613.1 efflux RND transporter periplasmic adaptor subunit [Frigidibacter sp. RF13]